MRREVEYSVARLFILLFQALPFRLSIRVGAALGRLFYHLDRRHRRIAIENLRSALGEGKNEDELKEIARSTFENLGRLVSEFIYTRRLTDSEIEKWVQIDGFHHYQAARSRNRGVILLTAHFGNWELMPLAFSLQGLQMYIVARALDNLYLERMLRGWRERNGNRVLNKKTAASEIMALLRKGETVGFLLDQNTSREEAVFVDYFKRPAATHKGLAIMALRTGAPVLPAFIVRRKERHQIIVEPPLEPARTGHLQRDIEEATALFTRKIEAYVRLHPDHWFWVHQRWKTKKP